MTALVCCYGCDTCSGETDGTGTVVDNPERIEACDDDDANTINDTQNDGCECVGTPIVNGCTDASACNYNPVQTKTTARMRSPHAPVVPIRVLVTPAASATIDDGSCEFTSCAGCTDAAACN